MRDTARRQDELAWGGLRETSEAGGWFGRLTDILLAYPVRTVAVLALVSGTGVIAANALMFQSGPHPSPLFVTRDDGRAALASADGAVPLPRPRALRVETLIERAEHVPLPRPEAGRAAPAELSLVANVQRNLAVRGFYTGPEDGIYGAQTRAAIVAYQERHGLTVNGAADRALLDHLEENAVPGPETTASVADREATRRIEAVQTALNAIGYGPVQVSGRAGDDTADALRRFELDNGMTVTGEPGEAVVGKLVQIGAMDPL